MKERNSDLFTCSFNDGEQGLFNAMSLAEEACQSRGIPQENIFLVNLCIEELTTNALKYGSTGKDSVTIEIIIDFSNSGIVLVLLDDANPFNPLTQAPAPDLNIPIEERKLGGLGIHLLKTMTRSMEYEYKNSKNNILIKI